MSTTEQGHVAIEGGFDAGEVIIGHVSNSSPEHPILHLPTIFGIDFFNYQTCFNVMDCSVACFYNHYLDNSQIFKTR